MRSMDLTEAMRMAAAVPRFRPDPVPDDVLYRALDAARFAPSDGNRQGWHVVVVRDQARRTQLKELYLRSWRPLYKDQLARAGEPDAAGGRPGITEGNYYAEHMDELPAHLVVLADRSALLSPFPAIRNSTVAGGSSIYPFVQNLLLAIRSEGLGASLTMLLNNYEPEVMLLLVSRPVRACRPPRDRLAGPPPSCPAMPPPGGGLHLPTISAVTLFTLTAPGQARCDLPRGPRTRHSAKTSCNMAAVPAVCGAPAAR